MMSFPSQVSEKSRRGVRLEHFATIDDPRDVRRIAHSPAEILLLVVCGTMADCNDYDHIAASPQPSSRQAPTTYWPSRLTSPPCVPK